MKANRIFENCKTSTLTKHEIQFPLAERVIQLSSHLFQMLDRTDSAQSEISRRLWVLKSSILFTALPFDDPTLRLQAQVLELECMLECLPDTRLLMDSLKKTVIDITAVQNPKREWLARMHPLASSEEEGLIGILTGLSAGRSPGWPQEKVGILADFNPRLLSITSKRDLKSGLFEAIILPCACSNVCPSLLSDLFYAGLATKVVVLLYPSERFQIPPRLILPKDSIFYEYLQSSKTEHETVAVPVGQTLSAVDTWINMTFWQGLHGAERSERPDLSPARYMLFFDGTGTFLPEDGRIMMLPADGKVVSENDLCMVRTGNVCEGDMIVMRSGNSRLLVDEASERIVGREQNESLFEMATDWKTSLDALLVTYTSEEVAAALLERGVSVSANSIQQWIGPKVLGPGDKQIFRELIYLLADKGKIQISGTELTSYVDIRWQSLQEVRNLHHKAGNLIRHDLFKALFSRLGNENRSAALTDLERIRIDADTEVQLLILRVAAVDSSTAYVQSSRLGKIDDLAGNKWLG